MRFLNWHPILFLHALAFDLQSMRDYMEPLFADHPGWQRIYVDLPGMGETRVADWIQSSDDILKVLLEFIDRVIPNQRFVLAGISCGGDLAGSVTGG